MFYWNSVHIKLLILQKQILLWQQSLKNSTTIYFFRQKLLKHIYEISSDDKQLSAKTDYLRILVGNLIRITVGKAVGIVMYNKYFSSFYYVNIYLLCIIFWGLFLDLSKFTRVAGDLSCIVITWIWTFIERALPRAYNIEYTSLYPKWEKIWFIANLDTSKRNMYLRSLISELKRPKSCPFFVTL